MLSLLGALSAMLLMVGGLTGFLAVWLTDAEKRKFSDKLATLGQDWLSTRMGVIKIPLYALNAFLTALMGEKRFSKKAICRSSALSIMMLIGCLGIGGFLTGTSLGITKSPWSAYDEKLQELHSLEGVKHNAEALAILKSVQQPAWKWVYSSVLIFLIIIINVAADVLSLAAARRILADLLTTDSPVLLSGALLLGLSISLLVANAVVLILTVVTDPGIMSATIISFLFSGQWRLLTYALWGASLFFAWYTSAVWIRAIAVSAALPGILLVLLSVLALILYPAKSQLSTVFRSTLQRALSHEKGPILFIGGVAASLAALLGAVITIIT